MYIAVHNKQINTVNKSVYVIYEPFLLKLSSVDIKMLYSMINTSIFSLIITNLFTFITTNEVIHYRST